MILQALNSAYERFAHTTRPNGKPRVPPFGFSFERIGHTLVLGRDGTLVDFALVDAEIDVPKDPTTTRTSAIQSMFLWDKTAYALGLAPEQKKRTAEEHAEFKRLQREIIGPSTDEGLVALLKFLDAWEPNAARVQSDIIGTNVVFRLDGMAGFIHERPAAKTAWLHYLSRQPAPEGRCLVTAEQGRIALTHPTLGGVRGAQSSGAAIVSFNQGAFTSYGKQQGANAPVSEKAAFAYTTALNDLLSRESKQKVRIGDATTVYWAEADNPDVAASAEQAVGWLFTPPPERLQEQLDTQETARLRELMDRVEKGRPLENPELQLDPGTRFYILGLSPNAARLSVRFWEMTTLGALGKAFHQHWRDLRIETPPPRGIPPSIAALALRTAPARRDRQDNVKFDFDDVSPLLTGELMRAILSGGRYPGSLLSTLVMRVRTDSVLDRIRISLTKATIVRAMRIEGRLPTEDYLVRTDPDDPNSARRLGRLFAVLERAQLAALGENINTTIKDKFLGAAAATPGPVFVGLVKNAQHHTKRLRNGHADATWIKDARHARAVGFGIERDIARLLGAFNDGVPAQHSVEEQGLFFVGYYQERFGGRPDKDIGEEPGVDNNAIDNTDSEQE